MRLKGALCRVAAAFGAFMLLTAPSTPQERGRLPALAQLQPGLWVIRDLDDSRAPTRSICLGDPNVLMQLEHRGAPCSRLVIESGPLAATVHYTCPATGFGRTTIRVETPRLAQIDTQGILRKAPFALRAEARRVGACTGGRR